MFSEVLLWRKMPELELKGQVELNKYILMSWDLRSLSSRKCIDIDPSEHLKTISKALSTGDIWPIMKVIYLASSLPERKHTNGLLFDKWFQWKHFPFLDKVFIHKESKKSMVEVFAKLKKVFGDSLKCPFLGSDSLHKATWGCSHSKTIFTENRRKF